MAGINVFHVEFGFNETELTSLLEDGCYSEAGTIIEATAHTSYLDEGCYQRTPLFIVLCGLNRTNKQFGVRNLKLARLLVQHGASPNFRVPETDFGVYINPGVTPLELIIEFYITLVAHERNILNSQSPSTSKWNPKTSPVIGMDGAYMRDKCSLTEELLELVFIFLSHGADCNIRNASHQTTLHRLVLHTCDLNMLKLLCESGADLNAKDKSGNTPLHYASMSCPQHYYLIDEERDSNIEIEECCHHPKITTIQSLLCYKSIEINHQNKFGQTALFHCMKEGNWVSAYNLIRNGCQTEERGLYSPVICKEDTMGSVSPLLIACMSSEIQQSFKLFMCRKSKTEGNFMFSLPLLDSGAFDNQNILNELYELAEMLQINTKKIKQLKSEIIHLIFGNKSLNLRQVCTRQVFRYWILHSWPDFNFKQNHFDKVTEKTESQVIFISQQHTADSASVQNVVNVNLPVIYEENLCWDIIDVDCEPIVPNYSEHYSVKNVREVNSVAMVAYIRGISSEDIENLVINLNLPRDSIVYFEVELLRMLLLAYFSGICEDDFNSLFHSNGDWSNGTDQSDEGDSDIEYW